MRIPLEKAVQAVHLLVEGVGIRACERLTGLNRNTVMALLETVGEKCARLLDARLRNLHPESIQVDEIWQYCFCKEKNVHDFHPGHGSFYTFLAIDRASKLVISHLVGKRDLEHAHLFMADLSKRFAGRAQLTTDGFRGYLPAVYDAFEANVDYAQQEKKYAGYGLPPAEQERRYSPEGCVGVKTLVHIGFPITERISTSHVERMNLSVRLFNRRFTRLTLGFSKKLANLKYAVALFFAHFNFCRVHGAHGRFKLTPAMAAGIAHHAWTVEELLTSSD
jgi:IS1 family transposase